MGSTTRRTLAGAVAVGLALTAFSSMAQADGRDDKPSYPVEGTVVASGLHSPRHLTVARNGDIYVAESGTGGTDCIIIPPEDPDAEELEVCAGDTGAITRISRKGGQKQVVTGLPSVSGGEDEFTGPSDVSIKGNQLMVTIGLGGPPAARDMLVAEHGDFYAGLATVQSVKMNGHKTRVKTAADLAGYEAKYNPHPAALDTNPNAISADGKDWLLADAGGNDLLRLDKKGKLRLLAVLPDGMAAAPPFLGLPPGSMMPFEPVPTAIERGPDGAVYVSQLTGFPFPVGGSSIWRISRSGVPKMWATGLTNVTDLTFDDDGNLYAVQIANQGLLSEVSVADGSLIRVRKGHDRHKVIATGLFAPYGVAVHKDYAYVTTGAVLLDGGQVLRFTVDDDD